MLRDTALRAATVWLPVLAVVRLEAVFATAADFTGVLEAAFVVEDVLLVPAL